jgi:hypothetical protein
MVRDDGGKERDDRETDPAQSGRSASYRLAGREVYSISISRVSASGTIRPNTDARRKQGKAREIPHQRPAARN